MVKVAPKHISMKFKPIVTAMSTDAVLAVRRWTVVIIPALLLALAVIACEPNTRKAEAAYNRGMAAQRADDHSKAVEEFTEAIKQDPDLATAYYSRGVSYAEGGNHRLALDDFTRAVNRDTNLTEAYHKRATTYNATGEFGRAVSDFDRVLESGTVSDRSPLRQSDRAGGDESALQGDRSVRPGDRAGPNQQRVLRNEGYDPRAGGKQRPCGAGHRQGGRAGVRQSGRHIINPKAPRAVAAHAHARVL